MNRFSSLIEQKSRDVIDAYWESRARWNPAKSLKNLTAQATQEYENRFLIELIQNAYDVHPPGTHDGGVNIRLNREEERHGVLYVANRGMPFKKSNFLAITEIAQSDKLPGAGIGNKGVGFRSVLQVCPWPEIYSADPEDAAARRFNGFCFRFATPDDVHRLVGQDDAKYRAVLEDISPYFLPVPLASVPASVRAFGRQGMVTVLRLPLHKETALVAVEKQIAELLSATVPVMLFLDRLSSLMIEVTGGDNPVGPRELRRRVEPLGASSGKRKREYEIVDLGDQGRFFFATGEVPRSRLDVAIEESIEAAKIEPKWRDWKEKAHVSAAVRLDEDDGASRLYTFLPMGPGATAPFAGHLNAPFATKLARTSLSEDIPLNALLLDVGAELAADAILFLRTQEAEYSGNAIIDLLTWREPHHERLTRAFAALGKDVREIDIVPILPLPDSRAWGSLNEFCLWDQPELSILTPDILVRVVGAELLRPTVEPTRVERLDNFCGLLGLGTRHSDDTVAGWFQSVAEHLQQEKFQSIRWDAFYDDLASYPWDDTQPLVGRKFLLDDEGQLRTAGRTKESDDKTRDIVFFQPTKERTEDDEQVDANLDLSVPATLKKHICFMHPDLAWYKRDGSTLKRKASRDFLQKHGLIQRYDTRGVIEHVGALLGRTESQRIFSDALRWTFNLQRATGSSRGLGLEKLPLRVPTPSGWVAATEAFFSADWTGTRGRELADLIAHTKGGCDELSGLEGVLLLPPAKWPFAVSELGPWTSFLRTIGVQDGLTPRPVGRPRELGWRGRDWTAVGLAKALNVRPEDQTLWVKAISAVGTKPSHPNTAYQIDGVVYRLPGQSDHGTFTQRAKELFARLIFDGLARWPDQVRVVTLKRRGRPHDQDAVVWPSPLAAFLSRGAWVPLIWPRERRGEVFCPPREVWHFSEKTGEPLPAFSPFLPSDLRRAVDSGERTRTALVNLGLNTWNEAKDAKQLLLHLGALVQAGEVEETHTASFKRIYEKAWTDLVQGGLGTPFHGAPAGAALVVTTGDSLTTVSPSAKAVLYVQGGQDQLAARLLNNLTLPVLSVGSRIESAVTALLTAHFPRAKAVSTVKVGITVDGQPYQPRADSPSLIDGERSWLKELVVLTIELRARLPAQRSDQSIRSVLCRLGRIRLQRASRIAVVVDGHDTELPPSFQHAMPVKDGQSPTILWKSDQELLTWDTLATITPALAQILELPSLTADLHLAVIQLSKLIGGELPRRPTLEEFSRVFNDRPRRVEEVCRGIRSAAPEVLETLRPVLWHFAGAAAAATLPAADDPDVTEEKLVAALIPFSETLPLSPKDLLRECAETTEPGTLRTRLNIGYAEFNQALRGLGAPYRPIHNREGHSHAFAHHKQSQRERILRAIRAHYLKQYEQGLSLDGYLTLRNLEGLTADPEWLDVCDLPTPEMMEKRVATWIAGEGVKEGDNGRVLSPIDSIRATNRRFVGEQAARICRLVRAWCAKKGVPVPTVWTPVAEAKDKLLEMGDSTGVFDFVAVTSELLLAWLARQGGWPSSMPATLELAGLVLTEDDLNADAHAGEEERRRAEFERRSIELDGKRVSAEPSDFSALAQALIPTVTNTFLKRPKALTALEEVKTRATGGHKPLASGGGKRRPTDTQKVAIGFVGELLAYEWIKRKYKGVVPENWCSTYRNYMFGGNSGSDGLGYDFEVLLSNRRLLFEVKATAGDHLEIELGETEVAVAQKLSRGNQYRILFIPHALDSKARSLYVLPNPFSEVGRRFYRVVGTGLRYQFQMKL